MERAGLSPELRAALLVGLLGSFTTFSTFALESFSLVENGTRLRAAANVGAQLVLCLAAVWLGIIAGRKL